MLTRLPVCVVVDLTRRLPTAGLMVIEVAQDHITSFRNQDTGVPLIMFGVLMSTLTILGIHERRLNMTGVVGQLGRPCIGLSLHT